MSDQIDVDPTAQAYTASATMARHERLLKKAEDAKRRLEAAQPVELDASIALGADAVGASHQQQTPVARVTLAAPDAGLAQCDPFGGDPFEGQTEDDSYGHPMTDDDWSSMLPAEASPAPAPAPSPAATHSGPISGVGMASSSGRSRPEFERAAFEPSQAVQPAKRLDRSAEVPPVRAPSGRPVFSLPSSGRPNPMTKEVRPNLENDPPWLDDLRPAGSRYSNQEWANARGTNDEFHVIEFVAGRECALIRFNAASPPTTVAHKDKATGKTVATSIYKTNTPTHNFYSIVAQCFDGCLILGPAGKTDHPGRERRDAIIATDPLRSQGVSPRPGRDMSYSIIEPKVMRNELGRGAVLTFDGGPLFYEMLPSPQEQESTVEEQVCTTERPKG